MESIFMKSYLVSRSVKFISTFSPITLVIVLLVIILTVLHNRRKHSRLVKLINKIPGPPALPYLGNTIEINVDHDEIFSRIVGLRKLWGRRQGVSKAWLGTQPYVFLSDASKVEVIMGSPKHIDKSDEYEYLKPWLGTGLLTSHGKKWHTRRKILTPAFHFKILEDFIDVFQEQSAILVSKLSGEVGKDSFNIFPYVTLCTLDIICETAMGRSIHAQSNSDSEYVKAVYKIGEIIQSRQAKLWLQFNLLFRLSNLYKEHQHCIKVLHEFSYRVIRERKEEINNIDNNNNNNSDTINYNHPEKIPYIEDDVVLGKKKRLAFLDLLIESSKDGTVLSNDDIREEVDTFMFEGHDTTSAAISWSLFLLGSHPEIQERVFQEIDEIMCGDRNRPPTMKELNDMRYLECAIREALRLYPSVPLFARHIREDVNVGEFTIPAGTMAMIVTYMLHRDPAVFPKPEQFNPDHFLPESCHGRHPYAYIPFSAGPRNCIGQKFAILEEKSVISAVLRKYRIESIDRREDLTLLGELILRPKDGLRVKITLRD